MTGIRRTSSSDTYRVLVEAYHNIADGEIDRVEFAISVNGSLVGTQTVTEREMWFPNDSSYDDPLPGDWGGGPAPLWCFGYELLMSNYSAGYIDIVPTVYAGSGESVVLETIRVYNDSDGTDRRPCTGIAYWDWNSGDDSNTGLTTGSPVKTFQKALEVIAASNDVGGGTVYVNAAGTHKLGSRNLYSFGANLYTSGHHWITVMPRPGLSRDDIALERVSTFDGDWMTFSGTGAGQRARLRISNCIIYLPGFNISSGSNIILDIWTEHVLFTPPPPFNQHPYNEEGTYIRMYDYNGAGIGINPLGTRGLWYSTSCTRKFGVFGNVGNKVRGAWIDSCIGVQVQYNNNDEAVTNIYNTNVYQNYGVSGYFAQTTTGLAITNIGGNSYKVIPTDPSYSGPDIADAAQYLTGSTSLGILLAGLPTSSNNVTWAVTGYGYTLGVPYVVITGAGLTAETATGSISPGKFGDTTTWEVFGPHSDLVQVNSDGLKNLIYSNVAAYRAWQTQGVFSNGNSVSGMAIVNVYDGRPLINNIRHYLVGSYNKHLLFRNATLYQMEVLSTQTLEDCEVIDCVFDNLDEFNGIGSTTTYASLTDFRYNHFIDGTDAVGTNNSTGEFFELATPSESTGAYCSATSTAYATASTLWPTPTEYRSVDKGAWSNVSYADWGIDGAVDLIVSGFILSGSLPSYSVNLQTGVATATGSCYFTGYVERQVNPDTLVGTTALWGYAETSIASTILSGSTDLPTPGIVTELLHIDILAETLPKVGIDITVILDDTDAVASVTAQSPSATASAGTWGTATTSTANIGASSPAVHEVITTSNPEIPIELPTVVVPRVEFNNSTSSSQINLEAASLVNDLDINRVLGQLSNVSHNITRVPLSSQAFWSQNIVGSVDKNTNKKIINIMTANYQNFAQKKNREASVFRNKK
jgi:hypothetical protein